MDFNPSLDMRKWGEKFTNENSIISNIHKLKHKKCNFFLCEISFKFTKKKYFVHQLLIQVKDKKRVFFFFLMKGKKGIGITVISSIQSPGIEWDLRQNGEHHYLNSTILKLVGVIRSFAIPTIKPTWTQKKNKVKFFAISIIKPALLRAQKRIAKANRWHIWIW